ncbi:hypothetical protein [Pelomonas sp. SE-A7]|uniref:FFLEELY motif protein n=1 Tax=Pelomonas sp. SE-A7 TaxID=3054953 RepID=UPI00259CBE09|nr:hypothetical protein [Pelomonas sp. SE-A7]MDM4767964.1 hypothetical protein [Pelomonas sp. SE-A7]
MDDIAAHILSQLSTVDVERRARGADPMLENRVEALKLYQQQRFARTYADLLASERYRHAARFFLEELYGPGDFSRRDAQFARVVPSVVRLFPRDVVTTVAQLAELHALSERLDSRMGKLHGDASWDRLSYIRAWQACGMAAERQRQIDLTLSIGAALEGYTRKPLLRHALRMMRGPATAAGMLELQQFLETGFDTFREMHGAAEFLRTVREREEALAQALFGQPPADSCPVGDDPLGKLP